MARARSKTATTKASSTENSAGEFTCPECGKTFSRAAALGAHRNRAHGVAGATRLARRARSRANSRNGGTSRNRGPGQRASQSAALGRTGRSGGVDHDALLRTLFPSGLPAREEVIRRANAWLDEAEKLARAT